jgi:gamma-glutamylputrescine oxidase
MSCHAGRRLAEALAGEAIALPAPLTAQLPKFPFAAFRRLGQALMMRRYRWLDRRD